MTDDGTVATPAFDDARPTVVSVATARLSDAVRFVVPPRATVRDVGDSDTESAGMSMRPLTSVSWPLSEVSFVAAVPPESVSCVSAGSSVSVIELAGTAFGDSVTTSCATGSRAPLRRG
jgi:hypothetical protein